MTAARGRIGRIGEALAARHLSDAGLELLACNWRCARGDVRGELDIVARDGDVLVVCEVKTRRRAAAGEALVAITPHKQVRLRRLAAAYLADHPLGVSAVRFDAVAVSWPTSGGGPEIVHLRDVT